MYSILLRCLLATGFAFLSIAALSAQGGSNAKTTKVHVGNCDYQVLSGLAEVTRVEKRLPKDSSALQYDEHVIYFKFTAKEGGELMANFREQELEFFLISDGEKFPVGPQFMKQYQIRPNTKYAMKFLQGPACEEKYRFGDVGGLPNDITEASTRLEELKKIRREEEFRIQDSIRSVGDTVATSTSVPNAMSKEDKKHFDDSLALEKRRVDDSIAEHKRNFAFLEQESKRAKADSAYLADSVRQARIIDGTPITNPTVIVPKKVDSVKVDTPLVVNPVDSNRVVVSEIDKERIKREVEERLRKEQEEKNKQDSIARDKERKANEAQAAKDSIAQDKIRQKDYKKFLKDSIKMAKIETARIQDSLEQAKVMQDREDRRLQDSLEQERIRLEKSIEEDIRKKLQIEQAQADSFRIAEEARQREAAAKEAERQKIAAEKAAAEKKRNDDEIKRIDCKYNPKISGTIQITEVKKTKEADESFVGYAEYEVRYKFTPSNMADIPKKDQKIWETEYLLVIDPRGKSANPSAAYITTYNVFKNARFNGFAEVLSTGICNSVIIYAQQLPVDAGKLDLK